MLDGNNIRLHYLNHYLIISYVAEERRIQAAEIQAASNLLAERSATENENNLVKTKVEQNLSVARMTSKSTHSRFK